MTTKYNVGDVVWFITPKSKKIYSAHVDEVRDHDGEYTDYLISSVPFVRVEFESNLYASKEEAENALRAESEKV